MEMSYDGGHEMLEMLKMMTAAAEAAEEERKRETTVSDIPAQSEGMCECVTNAVAARESDRTTE